MRAVFSGDWHLESGANLGHPDADLGSTRMADARKILAAMTKDPRDAAGGRERRRGCLCGRGERLT